MASYLTPQWLMQDIGQLLNPLSQEDWEEDFEIKETTLPMSYKYYDSEGNQVTTDAKGLPITSLGKGWYEEEDSVGHTSLVYGEIPDLDRKMDWSKRSKYTEYGGEEYATKEEAYDVYKAEGPSDVGGVMWDSEEFAGAIGERKGLDPTAKTQTSFTPEMFKKLRTEYYQPEIEEKRGTLIDRLIGKQRLASAEGGGFAGYGGRERAHKQLEESYAGGVEDIYSGIEKQKAAGLQSIYDVMSQYEAIE